MTEKTHARLSPSGADRWTSCYASVFGTDDEDKSSPYADHGTACHKVAEWCLVDGTDAVAYKGRRVDVRPGLTIECDDDMIEVVQPYVDNVRARVKMYEDAGAIEVKLYVELDVPIDHITGEEGATGGADAPIVAEFLDGTVVDMSDLKTGRGKKVNAVRNKQLAMYADGVIRLLDIRRGDVKQVVLAVHQTRLSETPLEYAMDVAEFDGLIDEIRGHASKAILFVDSDTPPCASDFSPSEEACQFCRKKATCDAARNAVTTMVYGAAPATPDEFEDLTQDTLTHAQEVVEGGYGGEIEDWLAAAMDKVDQIESWCKAVRAEVESRLLRGTPIPRYKLVAGRKGARAWANAEEAEKALKAMRLKVEEMFDLKLISPTTAEKLHKAGTIGPRQWPKLQGLITQGEGSPSVAREDDKRPALVIKPVADDFEDLTESEDLV